MQHLGEVGGISTSTRAASTSRSASPGSSQSGGPARRVDQDGCGDGTVPDADGVARATRRVRRRGSTRRSAARRAASTGATRRRSGRSACRCAAGCSTRRRCSPRTPRRRTPSFAKLRCALSACERIVGPLDQVDPHRSACWRCASLSATPSPPPRASGDDAEHVRPLRRPPVLHRRASNTRTPSSRRRRRTRRAGCRRA